MRPDPRAPVALKSMINTVAPDTARLSMPPRPPLEVVFMLTVVVIHDMAPASEKMTWLG